MTEKTHASLAIPARDTEDGHALPPRGREWKRAKIAVVVVLVLLVLGAGRTVVSDVMRSRTVAATSQQNRSEEHTSELQSHLNLVCRLLLEKKKKVDSEWCIRTVV